MSDRIKFSLFKRRGIYYILYWQGGKQRWKSTGCKQKGDALKALTNLDKLTKERPPDKTLSQFIKDFFTYAEGNYSKGTVAIYRAALNRFLSLIGDCPVSSLTPQHADAYKVGRLQAISPVTVNIDLRTLRAAFNVAKRWRFIEHNPFTGIQLANPPEIPPSFFTRQDFQKLIDLVKENWLKEIIVFAALTGMRRGEIVNLRWREVDLTRKVIHIQSDPTFRTKHGKRRTIPLGDVAAHLLLSRHGRSVSEYVFTLNDRKIAEGWVSHKFKYYVYEARLNDDRLHFHSLRHTFASWLVQDGVSLYEVQKLLGHSSIAVTQVYSHLQPEQMHETVNRLKIEMN